MDDRRWAEADAVQGADLAVDRIVQVKDALIADLERGTQPEAQRRYQQMANAVVGFMDDLGGVDTAAFCVRTRAYAMARDGLLSQPEWRTLREVMSDWHTATVVDVLSIVIVLSHVGR
ncbi:MAG: hypothetical protein ACOYB2_10425 [Limnohabitans sp.]